MPEDDSPGRCEAVSGSEIEWSSPARPVLVFTTCRWRCRSLAAMHRWFRTPLTPQQGKRLQHVLWKIQQVDQDSAVECLPHFVLPSLVGWQHPPVPESLEDLVTVVQLRRRETSRVDNGERRQFRDREPCAPLLLASADPPEGNETESRVGPEDKRPLPTPVVAQEVGPSGASYRQIGCEASRQRLGVDLEITVEMQLGNSPLPCVHGVILAGRAHLPRTVRHDNHLRFVSRLMGPQCGPGRNVFRFQTYNVKRASGEILASDLLSVDVPVEKPSTTKLAKPGNGKRDGVLLPRQP